MTSSASLLCAAALLISSAATLYAQSGGAGPVSPQPPAAAPARQPSAAERASLDPIQMVGMNLTDAFASVGAPEEVFSYRGAAEALDDVVFYYPGAVYLFWYRSRVWQVRVDARFPGTFLGLRMGDSRVRVVEAVGRQYQEVDGSLVFFLPDASLIDGTNGRSKGAYPLRLRVFFQDGKLSDAYLYRGDF